ncbi:MAG: DUF1343 domain-containing protein [Blastocatellia bacterium]|nr:DUF1343 domain-containing protein [Blastocatellia bacterium]
MSKFYLFFLISVYLCLSAVNSFSQGLPVAAPQTVGMNAAKLAQIDGLVNDAIKDKKLPGAVVLVGHKGKIVYRKAFGNRSLVPTVEPMTVDTIFDVASLTKPVATATSIMIMVEQGKLRLSDTIGMYIPDIDDPQAKRVTIQQLLTHTSGYRPDFDLGEKWTGREGMLAALKKEKLRAAPGTKFVYSDIGFIVLGEIVQRLSTKNLEDFAETNLFSKLRVGKEGFTGFFVIDSEQNMKDGKVSKRIFTPMGFNVAPTENVKGQQSYLGSVYEGQDGSRILRGVVHDPTAYRMNGIAGHAGLFSMADDLARYCQMLLNGGVLDGKRVMSPQTLAKMTSPNVVSEDGATRGLGWDINTSFSGNRGELFPLGSFGHTGFTGTGLWIDRVSQTFVVFLSNRVHPDGKGDVGPLRAKVSTVVASAIEDTPIEKWKAAEAEYNTSVAAQMPKFLRNAGSLPASFVAGQQAGSLRSGGVLNGIDILERDRFKQLEGLRIGLVTNHTGRNLAGKQTIDILAEAKNVKLTAMFAPEHGIRGELDIEKIDDSKDEKTGLPIYSLYKDGMRRPKPEQTATIDAFVYDIQDIGARFYTYTATLKNVMEEAAKAGKPVFVLDRPNPINGNSVEGALADEDKLSFIAAHTTPVRYGLTIGELGMMMNAERKIGADLRVIKMDGWSRSMWFDETGQTWINPSPNMRSLTQATLYPGIGLLETTNVSVGRGTDTPFEVVGAPWMNGRNLAAYLNGRNIAGVRFVPIRFKPNASVFKDEECSGINIIITSRDAFDSVATGIEIATALRKLYATDWQVDRYARLLVNQQILDAVKTGESPENIDKLVRPIKDGFNVRRAPYLLYK